MKNVNTSKVGFIEKLSYGFSGVGINIFWGMPMMYLVIYFTDVFGISAAAVGTLLLVARIWDAVNDPMMGTVVDRTQTKWGKCRPYMIFGSIALAVSFVMLFSGPISLGSTGKLVYAYVAYILFGMIYTVVDIPSNALISSITEDSKERTNLVTLRRTLANFGMVMGIGLVPPLVNLFGRGNQVKGYSMTAIILGSIAGLLIMLSGITAKERVVSRKQEKFSVKSMINILKANTPLLVIASVFMVNQIATSIKSAAMAYYFSYNLGKPELIAFGSIISLVSVIVGTMIIPVVLKKISKKNAIKYGLLVVAISSLALVFISYQNITMIMIMFSINGLASAFGLALPFVLVVDTVEYGEWKTGIRSQGLVFSTMTFATKLATAIGGALLGYILTFTGYIPKGVQPELALKGILVCIAVLPMIVAIIGVILMRFYKLDEELYSKIIADLKERKEI